jgi:hypothetical protein
MELRYGTAGSPLPRLSPHVPRFDRAIKTSGVIIGIPCYGGNLHYACHAGVVDLIEKAREAAIPLGFHLVGNESLVQRARNGIVAQFLATSADRLIFIDADIGFSGDQVLRLLAHDRPVMAGIYRKKNLHRVDYAVNWMTDAEGAVPRDPATGAIRARDVGTGFLAIKREVFEAMARAFPHIRYRTPHEDRGMPTEAHAFFDCWIDPATGEYLSEDYAFCRRWLAMGGEVWVDPGIILDHHGMLPLTADPMEHLGAPPPRTPARKPARAPARKPAAKGRR